MGDLLVRGLAPETIDQLKAQAKQRKRSLQAEVKAILEEAARRDAAQAKALDFARQMRRRYAGTEQTDSTVLIREDRER